MRILHTPEKIEIGNYNFTLNWYKLENNVVVNLPSYFKCGENDSNL